MVMESPGKCTLKGPEKVLENHFSLFCMHPVYGM